MAVFAADMGATVAAVIFIVLLFNLWRKYHRNSAQSPPQPSGALPIIGHLHLLGAESHIAHTLANLADKYGPVFTLWLGMQRVVVVSSREAVFECFTSNDKSFANRPKFSAGEHLVYDHASFGFTNGPYWREMRKLHRRAVPGDDDERAESSDQSLGREDDAQHNSEDDRRETVRKRRGGGGEFQETYSRVHCVVGGVRAVGCDPNSIAEMDRSSGPFKNMKRVSKELDGIIGKWIDEHMQRRGKGEERKEEQDFIDLMLSAIDDKFTTPKLTIIKATVVEASTQTSVHLTWLLSLLVNNKHVLNLARQEIADNVGNQRWVQESDLNNLPYLHAIIKNPYASILLCPLPHEAVQDCRLAGYLIPKGTLLFVNLRKLHRDPRYWPEPDRFLPERFLTMGHAQVDVTGQQYEYIPFGMGRRSCPRTTFAMQVSSLAVARLIQGFDFATAGDVPVDMAEGIGITMPRANPLEVLLTPRLPSQLYGQ
ncbi:Xanthotoxin 5-hydroxylase CYP82C4 [Sesamum alatum]|uniref:Xanthotoxin 5-hydroxylase CYP82C4 n=1 Tax=Sesamum alatum TaxID=300844 RepID=A0AAE1YTQ4_9LAMI|nr:Xanthotoxin 5-hydroxylase CYP82C4 [Sesamum alatum]